MENISQRQSKVDINALSLEQVDDLSKQIGDKLRNICDEASDKANELLKIYGMNCKIAISIDEMPKKMMKSMGVKRKKLKRINSGNL